MQVQIEYIDEKTHQFRTRILEVDRKPETREEAEKILKAHKIKHIRVNRIQ